jgi:NAD(P)-dependent dehydrogenase (short-subunit alcohol dehydrogenase family)
LIIDRDTFMSQTSKIAVVTGAGSGIGRAAALTLLKAGYQVVLAGRRQQALDETLALAGELAGQGLALATDVSREDEVDQLFSITKRTFGRLDVLFNNAGIAVPGRIEDLSLARWQSVVDINLTGAFLCTRAAFRIMKDQQPMGGRIINNGSISAHSPRPNSLPYTATKHAITGLTKSTSLDGRRYDIACSQLDIGNAATELAARFSQGVEQANGQIAVEPVMDVQLVADAVLYMAALPLDANVQNMTLMATKMPFIGRG